MLVIALLLGFAAPAFLGMMERNRIETGSNQLLTSLMLTRSEALKRNQPVVLCNSADGVNCAASGEWEQGWLIYADEDADTVQDAGEPLIAAYPALRGGDTLRVTNSALDRRISYRADGTASGAGVFVLCNADRDTDLAREVAVELTGRPQRRRTTADCQP